MLREVGVDGSGETTMTAEEGFAARRRLMALMGGSLLVGGGIVQAATARLGGFRRVQQDNVMLHLDLEGGVTSARVFELSDPERLVIDLPATVLADSLAGERFPDGVVSGVRYGAQSDGSLRVVVDLRRATSPTHRFVTRGRGQRLVIDLGVRGDLARVGGHRREPDAEPLRDVIVAIDPGHGGRDPGAIGQRQTREKDIVLAVSKRLEARLASMGGVQPVMMRTDDTYVTLGDRIRRAREHRADLFVSVHADAFMRREAKGSSVYALSLDRASSEAAAWLARSENEAAALYGDLALEGLEQGVRRTILDLAQNSTLEASLDVGAAVLGHLGEVGHVHKPQVEQANFAVLTSPDIPSVLVETAFISNREEERKLNDPRYRERLAEAVRRGVFDYLSRRAPAGTRLHAERTRRG